MHFLLCLRRARVEVNELLIYYKSVIRSVVEYACPVWFTSITKGQADTLEHIQKRALGIIFQNKTYTEALSASKLPPLTERLSTLCKKFFDNMKEDTHKLNYLLPKPILKRTLRNSDGVWRPPPKCTTDRFKNSFIPHSLYHFQK